MKTSCLISLLAFAGLLLSHCNQYAMAENTTKLFPGSDKRMADACAKADLIVVGAVEDLGLTIPSAAGQIGYHAAKVAVKQVLKGDAHGTITVSIIIKFEKGRIEETTPEVGKTYIFFIRTDNETHRRIVVKVLPDDAETLNSVTTAIAPNHL